MKQTTLSSYHIHVHVGSLPWLDTFQVYSRDREWYSVRKKERKTPLLVFLSMIVLPKCYKGMISHYCDKSAYVQVHVRVDDHVMERRNAISGLLVGRSLSAHKILISSNSNVHVHSMYLNNKD